MSKLPPLHLGVPVSSSVTWRSHLLSRILKACSKTPQEGRREGQGRRDAFRLEGCENLFFFNKKIEFFYIGGGNQSLQKSYQYTPNFKKCYSIFFSFYFEVGSCQIAEFPGLGSGFQSS